MSQLTQSHEEVFRFVSIRAPGAAPQGPTLLELSDDSQVGAWLAEAPAQTVAEQLARLEQQARALSATKALLADDQRRAPLVTGLWKFALQGIASGNVQPGQLQRARVLLGQAVQLPAGAIPALALKLPPAFGQHFRQRNKVAVQQLTQESGERYKLEHRLRQLQDLENRLAGALAWTRQFGAPPAQTLPVSSAQEAPQLALNIHPAADMDQLFALEHPELVQELHDLLGPMADAGRYQALDQLRRAQAETVLAMARSEAAQAGEYAIRPAGVADLRVVRQVLIGYEKGELARIENVIAGETRERTHSSLKRIDATEYAQTDTGVELVREAQASERSDLGRFAYSAAREYNDRNSSVTETGTYGDVTRQTSTFMSEGRSREQAEGEDERLTREVMARAVDSVRVNVSQGRWNTATEEVQETIRQRQKAKCDQHVVAQYRRVDRVYQAQVYNHGARAVYEARVALTPRRAALAAADITDASWLLLASRFGVTLPAPPLAAVTDLVQASYPSRQSGLVVSSGAFDAREIRERGYRPLLAAVSISWFGAPDQGGVTASVGTAIFSTAPTPATPIATQHIAQGGAEISFNAAGWGAVEQFTVNFALTSVRTDQAIRAWQQACLQIIHDDLERRQAARAAAPGVAQMRAIERAALKRAVVAQARVQAGLQGAITEREARFLDLAFEWTEMSYRFEAPALEDALQARYGDSVHAAFLHAPAATVLLMVRPGYENALALYLETGLVEEAGLEPADEHVARMNRDSVLSNARIDVPVGEAWQYRLPTSMVILDDGVGGELPVRGDGVLG